MLFLQLFLFYFEKQASSIHNIQNDGFVEYLSYTWAAQQSVTKFVTITTRNLVTPKATAKLGFLFNKPASCKQLLSSWGWFVGHLCWTSVIKIIETVVMNLVTPYAAA